MIRYIIHTVNVLPPHIFLASFAVFIFLNTFENVIHYSIGRTSGEKKILMKNPIRNDWIRIIIIMIIFAVLQALLTCFFTKSC